MIVRNVGSVSYVGVICCKEVAPNLRVTVVHEHMFVGLANTVYIHRIWPYIRWFFCQKYRIHTVYIYRVLANPTCLLCVLAPSQCIFVPFFACRAGTWELKLGCLAPANASLFLFCLQSRLVWADARVPRKSTQWWRDQHWRGEAGYSIICISCALWVHFAIRTTTFLVLNPV